MRRALAAAQTVPVRGDIEANVAEHLRLVRAAAAERAQVLVFPELSLTGYELDLANELAFCENDPRLAPLIESAESHQVTLTVGAPVRIDGALYVGAFILGVDGGVDIYTKHHLGAFPASVNPGGPVPPGEPTIFQLGSRNPLIAVGDGTAALAICADTGHASHPQNAAARGAKTYLAGVFSIPSDVERDIARLANYGSEHSMAVVFANYGGPTGGLPSGGKSSIWSETGELLVQLDASGAGLAVATETEDGWQAKGVVTISPP
jgi:predicted amidohydrolase